MTERDLVLMCGAGGATMGVELAGWKPALCVDSWEAACSAHRKWMPHSNVVQADVNDVHLLAKGKWRFVWASPSCKPWSTANRTPKRGKAHPEYYSLEFLVEQVFDHLKARWLVIENVGGLVWSKEGRVEVEALRAAVAKRGFCLSMPKGGGTIASNTLGVAQLRRRVFLVVGPAYVSIRPGGELIPPAGTPPMLWETEAAEAVVGAQKPTLDGALIRGERGVCGPDHERGKASDLRRASTAAILKDDHPQKWSDTYRYGQRAAKGVVDASQPSRHSNWTGASAEAVDLRTQRSVEAGESVGRQQTCEGAPTGTGRTLGQCCDLQQIPAWVVEGFSKRVAHELVGNAVPPPVAEHIGRLILAADANHTPFFAKAAT